MTTNSAEIANFTPEEKVKYEHDMTTERDRRNQLAFSYDKGMEKGMEKGREFAQAAIAKKLAEKGFSEEEITELTRLD